MVHGIDEGPVGGHSDLPDSRERRDNPVTDS